MRKFLQEEIGEVLQRIYDSEINIEITSFWDGGFNFEIGDKMNGFKEIGRLPIPNHELAWDNIADVVSALAFAVSRAYPQSVFTKWYDGGQNDKA